MVITCCAVFLCQPQVSVICKFRLISYTFVYQLPCIAILFIFTLYLKESPTITLREAGPYLIFNFQFSTLNLHTTTRFTIACKVIIKVEVCVKFSHFCYCLLFSGANL